MFGLLLSNLIKYCTSENKINAEPEIRERLCIPKNLVLHFKRNDSRFKRSSSECPIGIVHGLLHVEVTSDIDLIKTQYLLCFR